MSRRMINPNQLQLLMKPSEIRRHITGSVDGEPTDDPNEDWESKKTDMLKDNIGHNGVKKPVVIDYGQYPKGSIQMGNGHHRVQAAKEFEDSGKEIYVPVIHTEGDYMGYEARRQGGWDLPS